MHCFCQESHEFSGKCHGKPWILINQNAQGPCSIIRRELEQEVNKRSSIWQVNLGDSPLGLSLPLPPSPIPQCSHTVGALQLTARLYSTTPHDPRLSSSIRSYSYSSSSGCRPPISFSGFHAYVCHIAFHEGCCLLVLTTWAGHTYSAIVPRGLENNIAFVFGPE